MKQEVAEKWVAALRSGEYQQTQQTLCVNDEQGTRGFCCLGVLCDMFAKEHPTAGQWERQAEITEVGFLLPDSQAATFATPPLLVRDWAGLKSYVGNCESSEELRTAFAAHFELSSTDDDHGDSLASANDNGATFEQIADFIEQHWEEL